MNLMLIQFLRDGDVWAGQIGLFAYKWGHFL
jgi:hypothetical protein